MSMSRGSIEMGPAAVLIGSTYIYFLNGLTLNLGLKTYEIAVEGRGSDKRWDDILPTLTGTPSGMWTSDLLSIFYPHLSALSGSSIYGGGTDATLAVIPLNGTNDKITFPAYGVRKMPSLSLSAGKAPFGAIEFGLPIKNNVAWSNAAARFTVASNSTFSDSSFAFSSIKTVPYTVSLSGASSPWDGITTQAGVEIDFAMKLNALTTDDGGTIDERFDTLDVMAKLVGVNTTMSQILTKLALQDSGVARGVSLTAAGADMTITGGTGNPQVVVKGARLADGGMNFNAKDYRSAPLSFLATRSAGTGAWATVGIAS